MEDVKAFTLNHLPPKYVVLEPGDRVPRQIGRAHV